MTATTATVVDLQRQHRSRPPRTLTQPEVRHRRIASWKDTGKNDCASCQSGPALNSSGQLDCVV